MRYRLIVITHDGEKTAPLLERTIASFRENVTPAPLDEVLIEDGPPKPVEAWWGRRHSTGTPGPHGFCVASRCGWNEGAGIGVDFVYWLEHDFLHLRPLDLRPLAAVLDAHPGLAQMQMMRGPVNEVERAAGGLYESRPGQYAHCLSLEDERWLEHRAYLTTNPCLMRRQFMAEHPWPGYDAECEGRFGIDLVYAGYRFGVWGRGEPWVEHVGARTGFGY